MPGGTPSEGVHRRTLPHTDCTGVPKPNQAQGGCPRAWPKTSDGARLPYGDDPSSIGVISQLLRDGVLVCGVLVCSDQELTGGSPRVAVARVAATAWRTTKGRNDTDNSPGRWDSAPAFSAGSTSSKQPSLSGG